LPRLDIDYQPILSIRKQTNLSIQYHISTSLAMTDKNRYRHCEEGRRSNLSTRYRHCEEGRRSNLLHYIEIASA
ncbi:hypothetical protein, partial [Lunatimonas salinarum]|uniref:hypothetical protein n=1 Tax=Lunatimonas salinarum TaxID=1774590 RepID=UPI001AE045AE